MENQSKSSLGRDILVGIGFVAVAGGLAAGGIYLAKYLKSSDQTTTTSQKADSSTTTSTSASTDTNTTTTPTLSVSKASLSLTVKNGSYPTDSFVAAFAGLGSSATEEQKALTITSDDSALDTWLKIWCTRNGSDVQLASPYAFTSGETVYVQPLKAPTVEQENWYKIALLVKSAAFSVEKYVDVNIYAA